MVASLTPVVAQLIQLARSRLIPQEAEQEDVVRINAWEQDRSRRSSFFMGITH